MSVLDLFEPIYKLLPEVKKPEIPPSIKTKLIWSALAICIFFIMGNISVIGLETASAGQLEFYQLILASKLGTLITVGIGPIVMASIFLQLLMGAKIIDIDLNTMKDRARFQAMQKMFAIGLAFFEAAAYAGFGIFPNSFIQAQPGMFWLVVLQIAFGSIVLMYLDEVVSKYGIGSGIGLFIAGGVAGSFFWQIFTPPIAAASGAILPAKLFNMFNYFVSGQMSLALPLLIALIFSMIIFLVVVFAEGVHVNIPLTLGGAGIKHRYPVKFLYVSNMPVILASALFANIGMFANMLKDFPVIGFIMNGLNWITSVPRFTDSGLGLMEGLIASFYNPQAFELIGSSGLAFELFHAGIYLGAMTLVCVVFGRLWIEISGQGPEQVASQLQRSGMSIPGFRRDPRIIRQVLDRYILPISLLGGGFVGLLAGVANLTTLSLVSGTGILLTVGIVYRIYEELAKEAVFESSTLLKKLMG